MNNGRSNRTGNSSCFITVISSNNRYNRKEGVNMTTEVIEKFKLGGLFNGTYKNDIWYPKTPIEIMVEGFGYVKVDEIKNVPTGLKIRIIGSTEEVKIVIRWSSIDENIDGILSLNARVYK